ncbi:glycosyltransferase family 4 protein [Chitinolyticbacter meiyuanensis]|uniref:glycosyltransferase family 4 protein n=1 Tax=Chitinolyticbacter meiyuanensis TaxID=682798 RepID=UPI0011E5AF61|nr:glycosyltransferase family 4 protein [Chitinolyticbacter meiyuanensis]
MNKNVLYIDGVGPFGGASRSLFELVAALRSLGVSAYFVAARGTALSYYRKVADDVIETRGLTRIDNTQYSYYRGLRWLILLREVFHLPFTFFALVKAWLRWRNNIDLIHCNEITEIFPALFAKWLFKRPLVLHVRSSQRREQNAWRSRLILFLLKRHVSTIVAIDETVRSTLPAELPCVVVHNSFSAPAQEEKASRQEMMLQSNDSMCVGFVGNLQHAKGVVDLIRAAALVKERAGAAVEFVFVGGKTRPSDGLKGRLLRFAGFAQDVSDDLESLVQQLDLTCNIHFVGHRNDIHRFYPAFDVLAFPSHFDAPGRPVFEAAFYEVPCLVCVEDPLPDTVRPGVTGLCVPARDPRSLADAILWYLRHPQERRQMGLASRDLALEFFVPEDNAKRILAVYEALA